jgi:hypothetical protein
MLSTLFIYLKSSNSTDIVTHPFRFKNLDVLLSNVRFIYCNLESPSSFEIVEIDTTILIGMIEKWF